MRKILVILACLALALGSMQVQAQNGPSVQSYVAGVRVAANYAYGFGGINGANIVQGSTGTGTQSITACPAVRALADGRVINLFSIVSPISVDPGTAISETVIPTSVSLIAPPQSQQGDQQCAVITASFTYAHGASQSPNQIRSGTYGVQEAINDIVGFTAAGNITNSRGGVVVIDQSYAGTDTQLNGTATAGSNVTVFPKVSIQDWRRGAPIYWNPTPTGIAPAAPAVLTSQAACDATHQFCSDASVAGSASWGSTVFGAITCVDILGNESPASTTASFTSVASKAIDIASPVAEAGCVGWIPYLSLSGGSYAQAYQITPTATICTLTTLETITPACAMANTAYGQTTSTFGANTLFNGGAQITTYPVNTGQHFPKLASTVQTTASYTPMTNASVTYAYAPGNRTGGCGESSINSVQLAAAGGISASSTAAIPMALSTWTIPASCFNYIGAEFRVSGKFTWTEGGTSAATYNVLVGWDAAGTNTTTIPLQLCTIANTHTPAAAAQNGYYSCTVRVLTTGATGTALVNGWGDMSIATGQALLIGFANDTAVAASGSINLTAPARITVQFTDSGNTVTGAEGLESTLEILN